ncbi:hypothetical protein GGR92_004970 [Spirosoma lacussanchae]|uniref:hypothetical protein n=1 Tax=Spirosoma lacussanchae TaxID=1884249 RepID=UPI001109B9D4|nr:hypothetical protein [Spirosoma lacussanchae]
MFLVITTSTFLILATVVLLLWAGGVLWFTGRAKAKKAVRPTPTLMSFFQPIAGKTTIDVPAPMASFRPNELITTGRANQTTTPVEVKNATPPTNQPPAPEPLDDPTFATAELVAVPVAPTTEPTQPVADTPQPVGGFQLSLDRQLLSRLLSDDTLCEAFEQARATTLERQRETGRSYATLFREVIADKPADVQAVLLNLLTEDEVEDFV